MLDNSLRGQSKSNGFIENANRFVAGQIRTLRSALQHNLQQSIDRNHIIITWLVKYASTLITLFHVGKDGKTAYQRRKGKSIHPFLVECGEKVMYEPLPDKHNKDNKLDDRFIDGIYLGISQRNGEYFIGTADGIMGSRTIKRYPLERRWDKELIDQIRGVPWNLQPEPDEQIKLQMSPEFDDNIPERISSRPEQQMPKTRRTKLNNKDHNIAQLVKQCGPQHGPKTQ